MFLVNLASRLSHEEKKEFCQDTSAVFHAEFARLISLPLSLKYSDVAYHLFTEDGINGNPAGWPNFACVKLDNAKAQFKCPNPKCRRLWTSMRGRISFTISHPCPQGFVVLKIFGQNCQSCQTPADALWYMGKYSKEKQNMAINLLSSFRGSLSSDGKFIQIHF